MQALVLISRAEGVIFNPNYTKPQPTSDEILVRVCTAALNHRDVWITQGLYAGIKYPTILGSDGLCQIVENDGDSDKDAAETLSTQKYIINPNNNWGDNEEFQQRDYHILGLPRNGTFAEYLAIRPDRLHPAPSHLSDAAAAALPLAGLTAYRALFAKAGLQQRTNVEGSGTKQRVLISGIGGGVALLGLQFAVAAGAEVYVTSSSKVKIEQAIAMGASAGFNYNSPFWHKELVKTHGEMDIVIDSAAGDGFAQLVDTLAFGGKIVFYGGTNGAINNLIPGKVFWRQISILGSTMGSDADFEQMLAFVNQHKITPIVDSIYSLADGLAAFRQMENGKQFGKIVLSAVQDMDK
jgi:NADPH:quinone reductase-like Zn-dependent oxidoreductase